MKKTTRSYWGWSGTAYEGAPAAFWGLPTSSTVSSNTTGPEGAGFYVFAMSDWVRVVVPPHAHGSRTVLW